MRKREEKASSKRNEREQSFKQFQEEEKHQRQGQNYEQPQYSFESNSSINEDSLWQPENQDALANLNDALERTQTGLSGEQKRIIKEYSNGFKLSFSKMWKLLPIPYQNSIPATKAKHYVKNQMMRHQSPRMPDQLDPFIKKAFDGFQVDSPMKIELTMKVQETLNDKDCRKILEQELQKEIVKVQNIFDYQRNQKIMKQVPSQHQFLFAVRICQKYWEVIQSKENMKLSCFTQYLLKGLNSNILKKHISLQDIKFAEICSEDFCFRESNESEALFFIKLLSKLEDFDMTKVFKKFRHMPDIFWLKFFKSFEVSSAVLNVWLAHKEKFLRKDVWNHYKFFKMDPDFARYLTIFTPTVSENELSQLYKLQQKPNFDTLMNLLEGQQNLSYKSFESAAQFYLENDTPEYRDSLKTHLMHLSIDKWPDQVQRVEAFLDYEKGAINLVKGALQAAYYAAGQQESSTIGQIHASIQGALQELSQAVFVSNIEWQLELANALVHAVNDLQFKYCLVNLETGHGKSVIIQLVARALNNLTRAKVYVVCLNQFLAAQAQQQFKLRNNIEYVSIQTFFEIFPKNNCYVIYDEIDQMLGENAFQFKRGLLGTSPAKYRPCIMKQWGSVISFSGTVTPTLQKQYIDEFPNPFFVNVPSLRANSQQNQLIEVVELVSTLNQALIQYLERELENHINFVVIFDTQTELQVFSKAIPVSISTKRTIFQFDNFVTDFYQTFEQMLELYKDNFIVLTTRDGSRGIDYRGKSPAHVVICFSPANSADLIQSLGRGSRTLKEIATGSIICKKPLTKNPARYLNILEQKEVENLQGFHRSQAWCRFLHGKIPADQVAQQVFENFRNFVKAGMNLDLESHDPNGELTSQLLRIKESSEAPGGDKVHVRLSQNGKKKSN